MLGCKTLTNFVKKVYWKYGLDLEDMGSLESISLRGSGQWFKQKGWKQWDEWDI